MRRACVVLLLAAGILVGVCGESRAQVTRPDPTKTKNSEAFRAIFRDVVKTAEKSTVIVQAPEKDKTAQVALGTVVSADGFILTKASEVQAREKLQVQVNGKSLEATVVGVSEPHDLAMLKIVAKNLTPIAWAPTKSEKLEVGQWVASASAGGAAATAESAPPVAVGVISVERRKIPGRNGFLGVSLGDAANKGAKVDQVFPQSAAEQAGVKIDDVITAVNGKAVKNKEELIQTIRTFRSGDVVVLKVKRGDKTLDMKATLGANLGAPASSRFSMMNLMGGPISKRASDFPSVFQHDTVIRPVDCGGPLVDLSGKAVGVNIARAGRTETYALPADVIEPLLASLQSGKMAPVNANKPGETRPGEKPATRPDQGE